ncbi:MAG: hypothetical protein R2748_27920 [Bryobacterales bacterium]
MDARDRVEVALDNDDLYVVMTFAAVLDFRKASTQQPTTSARCSKTPVTPLARQPRRPPRTARGVPATLTGTPKYNAHAEATHRLQIEADFIGLMAHGLPQASNDICWRVGRVMNHGDGIYGGVLGRHVFGGLLRARPEAVVTRRLSRAAEPTHKPSPTRSPGTRNIPTTGCRSGNCSSRSGTGAKPAPRGSVESVQHRRQKLNGAYIALGLLYGGRDFAKTMVISMRGPGFGLQSRQRHAAFWA